MGHAMSSKGGVRVALFVVAVFAAAHPASAVYDPVFRDGFETVPAFYVSASTGSDGNPGTQAQPWKTINRAVKRIDGAPAGSIVHVRAGSYSENVVFGRDDITLAGYRNTPGDQPPILADATINPDNGDPVFPDFDPEEMPLLDGGDRASGIGIDLRDRRRISVRNINIRNYAVGVLAGNGDRGFVESHRLENVNVSTAGNTAAAYSGHGIAFGSMSTSFSNGNLVRNALIINAAAEGFKFNGDDNEAGNIRVYGTEGDTVQASTDYYVVVTGSRNRIGQSYIWRKPDSAHSGHGYTIKDNAGQQAGGPLIEATDNLFEDDVAVNMGEGFAVRHRGVRNNRFVNGTAYGRYDGHAEACNGGNGIVVRDGARANTFAGMRMIDACQAIIISDSSEDEGTPSPPYSGSGNTIVGALVDNAYIGISFREEAPVREAGDNLIVDSTFHLTRFMFLANRPAQQMRYVDTTFGGTQGSGNANGWFRGGTYATDVVRSQFDNCTFHDLTLPPGW